MQPKSWDSFHKSFDSDAHVCGEPIPKSETSNAQQNFHIR